MAESLKMPLGPVDYAGPPPATYCCTECGATGVKLWREYNTFLDHQQLYCFACACKDQKKEGLVPTENGKSLYTGEVFHFYHAPGMRDDEGHSYDPEKGRPEDADRVWEHRDRHCSIGWLVPAVPTVEGDTFWGYTSIPQEGCEWWYRIPAIKEPGNAHNQPDDRVPSPA
jgi:hypothetical protein